jgi:hypothetical protein
VVARPTSSRWTGGVVISCQSFGRRTDGSAWDRSRLGFRRKMRKEREAEMGGFIAGMVCKRG